jgi:pimeloyl-ACP methyl ester carboxylesterase
MGKVLRVAAITVAASVGTALVVLALWAGRPISTPLFRDNKGQELPHSVATIERWRVNGIDQSVIIRSADVGNPVLIWLHGGPGSSETPLLRHFNSDVENHFTVVYWDQRYAGRSLDPFGPLPRETDDCAVCR